MSSARRKRPLRNLLSGIFFLGAALLWARSYYASDDFAPSARWLIQSFSGRIFLVQWRKEVVYVPDSSGWDEIRQGATWRWSCAQFECLNDRDEKIAVVIPYWAICTLLGTATFAGPIWRRYRSRVRNRDGACITCGYDLRASAGRCPECGTPIASTEGVKA